VSRARVSSGGLKSNPSALLELLHAATTTVCAVSSLESETRTLLWARWYGRFSKAPATTLHSTIPHYVLDMSTVIQRPSFASSLAASGRVRRSCVLQSSVQGHDRRLSCPIVQPRRRSNAIFDLPNAYLQKCPSRSTAHVFDSVCTLLWFCHFRARQKRGAASYVHTAASPFNR
jgi:hypothetical protein